MWCEILCILCFGLVTSVFSENDVILQKLQKLNNFEEMLYSSDTSIIGRTAEIDENKATPQIIVQNGKDPNLRRYHLNQPIWTSEIELLKECALYASKRSPNFQISIKSIDTDGSGDESEELADKTIEEVCFFLNDLVRTNRFLAKVDSNKFTYYEVNDGYNGMSNEEYDSMKGTLRRVNMRLRNPVFLLMPIMPVIADTSPLQYEGVGKLIEEFLDEGSLGMTVSDAALVKAPDRQHYVVIEDAYGKFYTKNSFSTSDAKKIQKRIYEIQEGVFQFPYTLPLRLFESQLVPSVEKMTGIALDGDTGVNVEYAYRCYYYKNIRTVKNIKEKDSIFMITYKSKNNIIYHSAPFELYSTVTHILTNLKKYSDGFEAMDVETFCNEKSFENYEVFLIGEYHESVQVPSVLQKEATYVNVPGTGWEKFLNAVNDIEKENKKKMMKISFMCLLMISYLNMLLNQSLNKKTLI